MSTVESLRGRAAELEETLGRAIERELQAQQFLIQVGQEIIRAQASGDPTAEVGLRAEQADRQRLLAEATNEVNRVRAELTDVRRRIAVAEQNPGTAPAAVPTAAVQSQAAAQSNPPEPAATEPTAVTNPAAARVVAAAPALQNTNATGTVAETSTSLPALERQLAAEQARRDDTVRALAATDARLEELSRRFVALTANTGIFDFAGRRERDDVARNIRELTAQKELLETQTIPEIDRNIADLLARIAAEEERRRLVVESGEFRIATPPVQASAEAAVIAGDFEFAASQAAVSDQRRQACDGDWRVKLRLAGSADYLYKSNDPGILAPLRDSDGVIFPYTPQITTNYATNYSTYDLTHSNYRGYFYQNSYVSEINVDATFTAQDTFEANYLLAVIHFFRSATKMFYGQENNQYRGAPPPLVFLQGLGGFQFNLAPCLVQNFNYVLPSDVDYIRANAADSLSSLRRDSGVSSSQQGLFTPSSALRLEGSRIPAGGIPPRGRIVSTGQPCDVTYVPTKMQISLTLYPVQTRSQVSREFSFSDYANGRLIKRGFW